jgi:hypothetical protein
MEIFHLKKLYDVEVKGKYQVEIPSNSVALENLNDNMGIHQA